MCEMKPSASDLDSLNKFLFVSTSVIDGLKSELPKYLAGSEDVRVSSQTDLIQWWKSHETDLPNWAKACQRVLLVQPSSAAAERVFSILKNWPTGHPMVGCLKFEQSMKGIERLKARPAD